MTFFRTLDSCDYVSSEMGAQFWFHRAAWSHHMDTELELHVPCKDPLQLLMSNCYYPEARGPEFRCDGNFATQSGVEKQIDDCLPRNRIRMRFISKLIKEAPKRNITVKCFNEKHTFVEYIECFT